MSDTSPNGTSTGADALDGASGSKGSKKPKPFDLATEAETAAQDATAIATGPDLHARLEATEGLLQKVLNFIHWAFPGHMELVPGNDAPNGPSGAADPPAAGVNTATPKAFANAGG